MAQRVLLKFESDVFQCDDIKIGNLLEGATHENPSPFRSNLDVRIYLDAYEKSNQRAFEPRVPVLY